MSELEIKIISEDNKRYFKFQKRKYKIYPFGKNTSLELLKWIREMIKCCEKCDPKKKEKVKLLKNKDDERYIQIGKKKYYYGSKDDEKRLKKRLEEFIVCCKSCKLKNDASSSGASKSKKNKEKLTRGKKYPKVKPFTNPKNNPEDEGVKSYEKSIRKQRGETIYEEEEEKRKENDKKLEGKLLEPPKKESVIYVSDDGTTYELPKSEDKRVKKEKVNSDAKFVKVEFEGKTYEVDKKTAEAYERKKKEKVSKLRNRFIDSLLEAGRKKVAKQVRDQRRAELKENEGKMSGFAKIIWTNEKGRQKEEMLHWKNKFDEKTVKLGSMVYNIKGVGKTPDQLLNTINVKLKERQEKIDKLVQKLRLKGKSSQEIADELKKKGLREPITEKITLYDAGDYKKMQKKQGKLDDLGSEATIVVEGSTRHFLEAKTKAKMKKENEKEEKQLRKEKRLQEQEQNQMEKADKEKQSQDFIKQMVEELHRRQLENDAMRQADKEKKKEDKQEARQNLIRKTIEEERAKLQIKKQQKAQKVQMKQQREQQIDQAKLQKYQQENAGVPGLGLEQGSPYSLQTDISVEPDQSGSGKSQKGLSTDEIENIMKKNNDYLGTIPRDRISSLLPKVSKQKKACFIMNLDPASQEGSHWVGIYIDPRTKEKGGTASVEYYDSFARPMPEDIKNELVPLIDKMQPETYLKLKENSVVDQRANSNTCGNFAMHFLNERLRGNSFAKATKFESIPQAERTVKKEFNKFI